MFCFLVESFTWLVSINLSEVYSKEDNDDLLWNCCFFLAFCENTHNIKYNLHSALVQLYTGDFVYFVYTSLAAVTCSTSI